MNSFLAEGRWSDASRTVMITFCMERKRKLLDLWILWCPRRSFLSGLPDDICERYSGGEENSHSAMQTPNNTIANSTQMF